MLNLVKLMNLHCFCHKFMRNSQVLTVSRNKTDQHPSASSNSAKTNSPPPPFLYGICMDCVALHCSWPWAMDFDYSFKHCICLTFIECVSSNVPQIAGYLACIVVVKTFKIQMPSECRASVTSSNIPPIY